ncbi:MAG: hypothetical protein KKH68_04640 [Proteobacteria bacterium]|nr:hypothetical protein [Pseudomonadota bacterium]
MKNEKTNHVHLTDRLVLIGIGLGTVYWLIETFLYIISSYEVNFTTRLFGPDLSGVCTRIIVLCLFLIFGSHAQFTVNQRRATEAELELMKEMNEKLHNEISELKKA